MELKNTENVEASSLEIVLNEFSEEQKSLAKSIGDLVIAVNGLTGKLTQFEEKLDNLKVTSPPLNTTPIQNVISQSMDGIKKIVNEQPKSIVQEKRFLLFPEHNAREYYSVVLRWLLYIIMATYGYFLLKHIVDHWRL